MDEVRQVLQRRKMRNSEPNEQIYKAGASGDEILIVPKGQLLITTASGNPIGETGVFTGQARSATVTAGTE